MWLPIIHNLKPDSAGYKEAQAYNTLVANKPKCNGTLADKLAAIGAWQLECDKALDAAKAAIV